MTDIWNQAGAWIGKDTKKEAPKGHVVTADTTEKAREGCEKESERKQ